MKSIIISAVITLGLIAGLFIIKSVPNQIRLGSTGFSYVATSSTISVGPQAVTTLFSQRNSCASRIIATQGQAIMLSFNSGVTPTGMIGYNQAASTTVAYDSGLYGCGLVQAYGFNASSTITLSETTN